ncbi:MAG TPA: glutathione S-transferase family protein [Solirubrobacteraceae bacterium]|nr:glutathione S-transferase family protein [Solirubrobacteraceae bacterium]
MPASLYSAKARSYLRKQRIAHLERPPGDPRYQAEVMPATRRWIIPVLQTPEGALVQDTVDIIDYLEQAEVAPERSAYPQTPVQLAVAHLLELFGGEGLLRPAMHYRWNFDEDNLAFLFEDFTAALVPNGDEPARQGVFEYASTRMRKATERLGVLPGTIAEIERSYGEFLGLLDAHLGRAPYLLGGRPTLADFALVGPLYAHLARDPHPSTLMKRSARRVWRWVERMHAPSLDCGEYQDQSGALFGDDRIPQTLRALLAYVGEEFTAEMLAQVSWIDGWLAENPQIADGDVVGGKPDRRALGTTVFAWRGHELEVAVLPYRLYLLQRLQNAFADAPADSRGQIARLFAEAGVEALLRVRPRRRLERRENVEIWGPSQDPVLDAGRVPQ